MATPTPLPARALAWAFVAFLVLLAAWAAFDLFDRK